MQVTNTLMYDYLNLQKLRRDEIATSAIAGLFVVTVAIFEGPTQVIGGLALSLLIGAGRCLDTGWKLRNKEHAFYLIEKYLEKKPEARKAEIFNYLDRHWNTR
ncbi:MAG: hypothetical protein LW832_05750 [Parachlamydia sp.]|jgi:hypothetical protein|nr:hypothetical protein [Parachlamydia sp.]